MRGIVAADALPLADEYWVQVPLRLTIDEDKSNSFLEAEFGKVSGGGQEGGGMCLLHVCSKTLTQHLLMLTHQQAFMRKLQPPADLPVPYGLASSLPRLASLGLYLVLHRGTSPYVQSLPTEGPSSFLLSGACCCTTINVERIGDHACV